MKRRILLPESFGTKLTPFHTVLFINIPPNLIAFYKKSDTLLIMKIKFTEDIKLAVNDYSWGEEYTKQIKSGDVKEVLAIEDSTHGYKDIYFALKEVAEGVHQSAFVIL